MVDPGETPFRTAAEIIASPGAQEAVIIYHNIVGEAALPSFMWAKHRRRYH
jgi:hypothetical protein